MHGGSWETQNEEVGEEKEALSLQEQGFCVFSMNYTEAKKSQPAFPIQVTDIEEAVKWIQEHASEYNGNSALLSIIGGSSGGNISLLAVEKMAASTFRSSVTLSAITNFPTIITYEEERHAKGESAQLYQAIPQALGFATIQEVTKAAAEEWSPTDHIPSTMPPCWIAGSHSESEVPFSQQAEMAAALEAKGQTPTLVEATGGGHSFEYWRQVEKKIVEFIRAH